MTSVGLYIHIPFCASKCGYCDFYSTVPQAGAFEPLVAALLIELDKVFARRELRVETVFVGGGTPSLLPPHCLRGLFNGISAVLPPDRTSVEFTVEANPASLTLEKAGILRGAGVNRISLGAQSFHAQELTALERIHTPEDIVATAGLVHGSGFDHLNLDLIFGIPGQTLASWKESLRRAIDLGPDHLACYGLTYEPGTPLHSRLQLGQIRPADENLEAELYLATLDTLTAAGFEQYEISNFARAGARCWHNLRYWYNQPSIGVGPSAASYLDGSRWRNIPDTAEYVRLLKGGGDSAIDVETLSPLEHAGETAMLLLRLAEGIDCDRFIATTGYDARRIFADAIDRHSAAGLLQANSRRIALTRRGLLLADAIISDFLLPGDTPPTAPCQSPR